MFLDHEDYLRMYRILEYTVRKHGWEIRAFVLMTTHLHLLVWTPLDDVSRGMQRLLGIYAQAFNKEHARSGHLVGARFWSTVVERPGHALEVCRYIALNPVRAGLVERPQDWRWSSYAATIGKARCPQFLAPNWVLELFDDDPFKAAIAYKAFVDAAIPAARLASGSDPETSAIA